MAIETSPDAGTETKTGITPDDLSQLVIHVGFYQRPFFVDPNDSANEPTMKEGPPFVRFPVQLSAKDAGVLKQLLSTNIAFMAFEIQESDGKPGYYRVVTTRD